MWQPLHRRNGGFWPQLSHPEAGAPDRVVELVGDRVVLRRGVASALPIRYLAGLPPFRPTLMPFPRRITPWPLAPLLIASLAGCALTGTGKTSTFRAQEEFDSTTTYARPYGTGPADACEAARRALLSQGYVITATAPESVNGRKNFQPAAEQHVQVDFRVVCARDGAHGSIAFVNAVQDRYTLKKSNNSASVGVGAFGSLSLPLLSSDDSMVRVGSETVQDAAFYERFFVLLERYLPEPGSEAAPEEKVADKTLDKPAAPETAEPVKMSAEKAK
ncbi:MAG: hypothetical protein JWQ03_506 [Variovorax sp.]|nr:hypothetical protein [Variovorax sp.]